MLSKNHVVRLHVSEHLVDVVRVIAGLTGFKLLEVAIEAHNSATLGLLEDQEHHGWAIVLDLAGCGMNK